MLRLLVTIWLDVGAIRRKYGHNIIYPLYEWIVSENA